jgi:hypothetical protein
MLTSKAVDQTIAEAPPSLSPAEDLSPEFQVLISCAQAALRAGESIAAESQLPSNVRWQEFAKQAEQHGLIPIAHWFFRARGNGPIEIQKRLLDGAAGAVAANMQLIRTLGTVAKCLDQRAIPWLCVKGPVSAATLYVQPSLRPFSDLDLIIRVGDLELVLRSLSEIGYRPFLTLPFERQEHLFLSRSNLLVTKQGWGDIDLQWQLLPVQYSFSPSMNDVWDRADPVNALGVCTKTMGPYDTFVFLCLHAAKHDWERLIWLLDIAAFISRDKRMDWDSLIEDLQHPGRRTPLQVSMILVETLFGVDLPIRVSRLVRSNPAAVALSQERIKRWQEEPERQRLPWPWNSLFYRSMEIAADRRRYLHEVLLQPTPLEWKAIPLPFCCRGAYYAIRPIRLVWKHTSASLPLKNR